MKRLAGAVHCISLCMGFAAAAPTQDSKPTFTTFEAPGAGTGAGQDTNAGSINDAGAIAGYCLDAANVYHGFVRAAAGTITSFDAPGASMAFWRAPSPTVLARPEP